MPSVGFAQNSRDSRPQCSKPEARRDLNPRESLTHTDISEFPDEPKFGMKPPCIPDRLLVWGATMAAVLATRNAPLSTPSLRPPIHLREIREHAIRYRLEAGEKLRP